jgi:SAM-dependent methyltransferase
MMASMAIEAQTPQGLTPRAILEIATAFQRSRPLLTAYELGLFTVLNDEERRSAEVAAAIGADPRATDRLMNALVAMGLLEKRDGRFRNSPGAAASLVKGRPGYMAGLAHTNHLWDTWSGLTATVREGRPHVARGPISERDSDWLRPFIAAMHWRARQSAGELVKLLDLDGVSRVLDVGGGSGAYAMAFARARHGVSAVVFDLPSVVPLTRGYIQEEGLSAAVEAEAGDYLRDPLGSGYDLVFMSAVVHSNSADENRLLVRKAASALNPGGRLVIQDFLMAEDRTGPPQAALFALNMLVGTPSGDTYTESEVREWMAEAGLGGTTRVDTAFGTNVLVGRRP